jgi:hypothetical protein
MFDMYECHALDTKRVNFDDDGIEVKSARGGEASAPVRVSFQSPNSGFGKNHVELFFFFFERALFYEYRS